MTTGHRIPVLKVDLGPGIRAFFTTATGGVSTGAFSSLNLGARVGDLSTNVSENRRRVIEETGVDVRYLEQVHGSDIQDNDLQGGLDSQILTGDGQVTTRTDIALGVYVADCVPVIFADSVAGIVATAHAGRPGLELKVLSKTVDQMVERGAHVEQIRAAIGPCICENCYEVPEEMASNFARRTGTSIAATKWGTAGVSLRRAAMLELALCGITNVVNVDLCTYEAADNGGQLFSHRWSTHHKDLSLGQAGRFAGIVRRLG